MVNKKALLVVAVAALLAGTACTSPGVAQSCPAPSVDCGDGTCHNLQSEAANCGTCGHACTAPLNGAAVCVSGSCATSCPAGFTNCGGSCFNLDTDNQNCGACGAQCLSGTCANGICPSIDLGPSHTFMSLTSEHFITQGSCSPSAGTDAQADADYFCSHFYPPRACTAVAVQAHTLAAATDVKMHKLGGCTPNGTNLTNPARTCDTGACKIGNWAEITNGLRITCRCDVGTVGILGGVTFYKVPVNGPMTDVNVLAACQSVGMLPSCAGDATCTAFNDGLCKPSPEAGCFSPMGDLAFELCGTAANSCPPLNGVYQYMGQLWVTGSACGVEGATYCAQGSQWFGQYALCVK
jgi:hypothetical protein